MQPTMDEAARAAYVARYGHDWTSTDLVRDYVERTDAQGEERTEGFKYMAAFVPFQKDQPFRILDIGTGQGAVAASVLDVFPHSSAVGLDVSEPMMELAQERMASYGKRFEYCLGDFADGEFPANLTGNFDVVVSSRAIHHLPADKKRMLYATIYSRLTAGGAFFNFDTVAPSEDYLKGMYRQATRVLGGRTTERNSDAPRQVPAGHYYDSVDRHLASLRFAGFGMVDVFFKRMNVAVIGGYKAS